MKIISMSTREMFMVATIITCYDPFGLQTCLWLNVLHSLCSFRTCAPVKEVRLTSILSVQLMKHVSVFIYDVVVSAVMISQAHGERIQTMKKTGVLECVESIPLTHCLTTAERRGVCVHTNTQQGALTGVLNHFRSACCDSFPGCQVPTNWV